MDQYWLSEIPSGETQPAFQELGNQANVKNTYASNNKQFVIMETLNKNLYIYECVNDNYTLVSHFVPPAMTGDGARYGLYNWSVSNDGNSLIRISNAGSGINYKESIELFELNSVSGEYTSTSKVFETGYIDYGLDISDDSNNIVYALNNNNEWHIKVYNISNGVLELLLDKVNNLPAYSQIKSTTFVQDNQSFVYILNDMQSAHFIEEVFLIDHYVEKTIYEENSGDIYFELNISSDKGTFSLTQMTSAMIVDYPAQFTAKIYRQTPTGIAFFQDILCAEVDLEERVGFSFSSNGSLIFTYARELLAYEYSNNTSQYELIETPSDIGFVNVSSNGNYISIEGTDSNIYKRSGSSWNLVKTFPNDINSYYSIMLFSEDESHLLDLFTPDINANQYPKQPHVFMLTNGMDSDSDGLTDSDEKNGIRTAFGWLHTDYLNPDTDGDGLKDGEEINGLKISASEPVYWIKDEYQVKYVFVRSNPVLIDSDYDGINDKEDINPLDNKFSGKATRLAKGKVDIDGNVSFVVDYRNFFKNNTLYNTDTSVLSSLYALNIYAGDYVEVNKGATLIGNTSRDQLQKLFGMEDVLLQDIGTDNDHTEIALGHHYVEYNGMKREIIQVIVRGTNGTFAEWSSNYDVGADTSDYYNETNSSQPEWINRENHKGFDVTANRVQSAIDNYLTNTNFNPDAKKVIWFTGHSRGAAIANILGAKYERDSAFIPFTYAFATPNTTTSDSAGEYRSIFNIINEDDLIPCMPLTRWGFTKYGIIKKVSVKKYLEEKWTKGEVEGSFEAVFGKDYNSNNKQDLVLGSIFKIAKSREDLYSFTYNDNTIQRLGYPFHGYDYNNYSDAQKRLLEVESTTKDELKQFCQFKVITVTDHFGTIWYQPIMYQTPAYLMQTIASMTVAPFYFISLADKYESTRNSFVTIYFSGLAHPHYPEVSYLIATHNYYSTIK